MAIRKTKKKKTAGGRVKKATARKKPSRRKQGRDLRHLRELGGLALFATGIFLALVLYAGWSGGLAGAKAEHGLRYLFGVLAILVPAGCFLAGALLIFPEMPKGPRAFRVGLILLLVALFLICGANTFSVLGREPAHGTFFDSSYYSSHGGLAGEGLYWLTGSMIGDVGSTIAACFLLLASVFLLTGASVKAVLVASGMGARRAASEARKTAKHLETTLSERRAAANKGAESSGGGAAGLSAPFGVEPQTGALHPAVEDALLTASAAVPLNGAATYPDIFDPGPRLTLVDQPDEPGEPLETASTTATALVEAPADVPQQEELFPTGTEGLPLYEVPSFELLKKSGQKTKPAGEGEERVSRVLEETLASFGIEARVTGTVSGPRVTRYELRLAPGIKVSKVSSLKNDIAYALATTKITILAPIPGKSAVGVEVPNLQTCLVTLGDIYKDFPKSAGPLSVWLGKDISGKAVYADLARMPHLLVAGTTGSGKSGCINCLVSSVLLRSTPEQVRMILIDPKRVELSHFEGIPHLLTPVVTVMKDAANVLANLVAEMESRYSQMQLVKARHLDELNKVLQRRGQKTLPYILLVVDELADLIMVSPTEVEDAIIRLAQKSRAVGIHLVLATQRPSVDVITGMIKANVPSRIAFAVSSQQDSRIILDANGAESLLGQGDMLFSPLGSSQFQRIQGAYISEEEIKLLTDRCKSQSSPDFEMELLDGRASGDGEGLPADEDDLLPEAMKLVVEMGTASVSVLQRRLRVGYTRAGRLIDMLERRGIISGYEGSKPRRVLIGEGELGRFQKETVTEPDYEPVETEADSTYDDQ